jgi:hypothetical protein
LTGNARPSVDQAVFHVGPDTDYLDMGFHVAMLSVATNNIPGYAETERGLPDNEKVPTALQSLINAIETMHSTISASES